MMENGGCKRRKYTASRVKTELAQGKDAASPAKHCAMQRDGVGKCTTNGLTLKGEQLPLLTLNDSQFVAHLKGRAAKF